MAVNDRVVIVTGASRGIGKGLAIGLAQQGAKVVCAARSVDTSTAELPGTIHETVAAIHAIGGSAIAVRCDIGIEADLHHLVAASLEECGRIRARRARARLDRAPLRDQGERVLAMAGE